MDGIAYFTAEEWLGWINKTARPKMAAFLRENIGGKILKTVPREKDKGEAITLTMAAINPWHGTDGVYFAFSQVINGQDGRKEIFGDGYASMENLLILHGKDLAGYNPAKEYTVSRAKTGRPRAILTDDEKARIKAWRQDKRGYNRIAADLRRSNRLIMAYCKEAGL